MAKAKRANTNTNTEGFPDIFQHFGIEPLGMRGAGEEPDSGDGGGHTKEAPSTASLLAQINALSSQVSDLNARLAAPSGAGGASGGGAAAAPQQDQPVAISLAGLPDPSDDLDGYQKGLSERISKAVEAGVNSRIAAYEGAQRMQQDERGKRDRLWSEFQEKYEDLADYEDHIEIAANKVARRAAQRGLDVQRYMFVTTDKFLEDVAAETRKLVGPLLEKEEGAEGAGEGDNDEHPEGRTAGIFTGAPPETKGGKKETKFPSLSDDLMTIQRATGYY